MSKDEIIGGEATPAALIIEVSIPSPGCSLGTCDNLEVSVQVLSMASINPLGPGAQVIIQLKLVSLDDGMFSPKENPVAPVGPGNSRILIGGRADHGSGMGRRYKYGRKKLENLAPPSFAVLSNLYSSHSRTNSSHTLSKWARKLLSSLLVSLFLPYTLALPGIGGWANR